MALTLPVFRNMFVACILTMQEIFWFVLILHVSINTIRTHNQHIFTKLGVASRGELMVYVRMKA